MNTKSKLLAHLVCAWVLAVASALPAQAQAPAPAKEDPCLKCHAALAGKKEVHAAVHMGCKSCHTEVDASTTPHKYGGKFAKGLSAEGPALCANCHDKKLFEGKLVHGPVAAGLCLACHDAHTSDNQGLLTKAPATLCLDCHPDVKKGPHVIAGFTRSGHPLGNDAKQAKDPLRPGKTFYCGSCHEPHRSVLPKLARFGKGMDSCQKCHKM
jgi:predicted CXXCH cytochrome family protein